MESYLSMINRQQELVNNFKGIGFAFSNKQFTEMCLKLGIKENEAKEKLYSIGGGGYLLKSVAKDFYNIIDNNNEELENAMKDSNFAYSMFNYELNNHEYVVTYSIDSTLDALGLEYDEVKNNSILFEALEKAKKNQINNSCWN